jgi:regulator of sirC expression with transglutaminase-like and TPR domain
VFETGLGIPISLSVIAVAVGQRAGLSMSSVNAPGHFMAKLAPGGTAPVHYLDAFEGSIMDRCRETFVSLDIDILSLGLVVST